MAKLTSRQRDNLPPSSFALPAQQAYPIPDQAHARAALARVAANGTPSEQARVQAAVRKKFPNMEVAGKRGRDTTRK